MENLSTYEGVSEHTIRKVNNKRRALKQYLATENSSSVGDICITYNGTFVRKQIIITKDQISTAYRNALLKSGKKI